MSLAISLTLLALQEAAGDAHGPAVLDDGEDQKFKAGLENVSPPFPPDVAQPADWKSAAEASDEGLVADHELVIGLVIDGTARAYPIRHLSHAEILNDELAGRPLLVTWCVMCQVAVVYDRTVAGRVLTFGNFRALHEASAVLYDVETGSLWVQADGRAAAGALRGEALAPVESVLTTLAQWRRSHHDSAVFVAPRIHGRRRDIVMLWEPQLRSRMGLVVRVADEARHYPLDHLPRQGTLQDEVGGVPIVIVHSSDQQLFGAFSRRVGDMTIELRDDLVVEDDELLLAELRGRRRWLAATGAADARAAKAADAGAPALERLVVHPIRSDRFDEHFPNGSTWAPPEDEPSPRTWPGAVELDDALASGRDWFGETALRPGEDPGFDDFARLLPPLRFVNTAFRHYPIVLAAPRGAVKARLIGNGSGVNLHARTSTWRDDGLVPVSFFVKRGGRGSERRQRDVTVERFGGGVELAPEAKLLQGWLPIVETRHVARGVRVREQAFVATSTPGGGADDAVVFLRFELDTSTLPAVGGASELIVEISSESELTDVDGAVRDESGRLLAWHDARLGPRPDGNGWIARLRAGEPIHLAVFTRGTGAAAAAVPSRPLLAEDWVEARDATVATWREVLDGSMRLVTGEERVDDAWRALVAGTLMVANGDVLNYSAGNLYEQTFQSECGDAARALLAFGVPGAERFVEPLLARPLQRGLELWDVGHQLELLVWQHELLRDEAKSRAALPLVLPEAEAALAQVDPKTRIVPGQHYCGDEPELGHNLAANAVFWRGLRDTALLLRELGGEAELATATRFEAAATSLREGIHAAVAASERTDVSPPFVPIALFGAEQPYELLTQTRRGSYWNLLAPFVVSSGVLGPDSPRAQAMLDWQVTRGGLALGMVRFDQHSGLFANEKGVDDLYTLRLTEELLRRDDVERALVSFYGKLAQGMTRGTCVGGEASSLEPLDPGGRPMYLPPNVASNAFFLWTLRHLMVQDFDLDQDGRAETLRLLFATPRPWLADGGRVELERAPTRFGELSLDLVSSLDEDRIEVEIDLPPRPAARTLLRLRTPGARPITSARAGTVELPLVDAETIDLTGLSRRVSLQASFMSASGAEDGGR